MQDDTNELIRQMATLISAMQRREESLKQLINTELEKLDRSVAGVDQRIARAVESAPRMLAERSGSAIDQIAQRLDEQLGRSQKKFVDAADRSVDKLDGEVSALRKRALLMTWTMVGASVLMLGSVAYFAGSNRHLVEERDRLGQQVQWMGRVNRADVVPCGNGLCANVDPDAQGIGNQAQYRPVKARQAPQP